MRQVYKALSSHASSADAVCRAGYSSNFQGARSDTCTEARRGAATLLLETKRVPATGHVVENAMLLVTPMLSMFCRLCRATDQAQVGPSSLTVHYPSSYFDPEIILLYFSPGRVCRRSGNTMGNALGLARLSSLRQAPCGQINGRPGPKPQEPCCDRATDVSHWKRQQGCRNRCCRLDSMLGTPSRDQSVHMKESMQGLSANMHGFAR